jgi:hypothetical protein
LESRNGDDILCRRLNIKIPLLQAAGLNMREEKTPEAGFGVK